MAKIVQKDDPRLRAQSEPVKPEEFGSDKLLKLVADMSAALAKEDDGVAIAGPQIGVNKRIFLVSKKLKPNPKNQDLVFINPVIKQTSKKKVVMEEGCLSVRWLYGKTKRAEKMTIEAYDELGKKFTRHGSGVWAQVFQHEIDHLNGILFIDHAKEVEEYHPEK
jgi:peptide deformylase